MSDTTESLRRKIAGAGTVIRTIEAVAATSNEKPVDKAAYQAVFLSQSRRN